MGEGYTGRPELRRTGPGTITAEHPGLEDYTLEAETGRDLPAPELLFTQNETNVARLFGAPNPQPYVKDAFHRAVIHGESGAVNPQERGTKAAGRE